MNKNRRGRNRELVRGKRGPVVCKTGGVQGKEKGTVRIYLGRRTRSPIVEAEH